jgi:hypothetical protein
MEKIKHIYSKELGQLFMRMTDEEYFDWLKTNEVEYTKPLLELINEDKANLSDEDYTDT